MADIKRMIAENIDATIIPGKQGEAALRNSRHRAEIADGEAFAVVLQKASGNVRLASGMGKASPGNVCFIYATLRAEDVERPAVVEAEVLE